MGKDRLLGTNFDVSYPPRVRLPATEFNPEMDY
jgi:hypothetical protein